MGARRLSRRAVGRAARAAQLPHSPAKLIATRDCRRDGWGEAAILGANQTITGRVGNKDASIEPKPEASAVETSDLEIKHAREGLPRGAPQFCASFDTDHFAEKHVFKQDCQGVSQKGTFLRQLTSLDSRVNPNTEDPGTTDGVDRPADPADGALSPHRLEPATVLVDVKAWPGNVSGFGKVGAPASLDIHCARRRLSRAGRGEETGSAAEQRN
jgi:hypothetical protein